MGGTILIVDDEPDLVAVLKISLRSRGFVVRTAADGEEGLEAAREHRPELIILDVMMPGIDGFEVCRTLKADPDCRTSKIIILSARNQLTDKAQGQQAGADAYLTKPFELEDVFAKIQELLRS